MLVITVRCSDAAVPERPVCWLLCPAFRRNPGRDSTCPPFLMLPPDGCTYYSLEWKRVVFCTFAGVKFLAESAPESRNLHLKFHSYSGVTPRTGPCCKRWRPPPLPTLARRFGRVRGQAQTVMPWGVPFFNRLRWQPCGTPFKSTPILLMTSTRPMK